MEVHPDNEQMLLNVAGQGKTILNGEAENFNEGDMVLVRPGLSTTLLMSGKSH